MPGWLRLYPVRVVIALALLTMIWQVWLAYQAGPKIPSDLLSHISPRGTIDLTVTLRFPPERFHILMFQRFGRVSGTEGRAVELRGVPVGRVREIAKLYWVSGIAPLKGDD